MQRDETDDFWMAEATYESDIEVQFSCSLLIPKLPFVRPNRNKERIFPLEMISSDLPNYHVSIKTPGKTTFPKFPGP